MIKGNFRFALEQLLNDVKEGVLGGDDVLERWDEARGQDWFVGCKTDKPTETAVDVEA